MLSKSAWICYPGDFEIYLSNQIMTRRYYRDSFSPPFWKLSSQYCSIKFLKKANIKKACEANIKADGVFNIFVNGKAVCHNKGKFALNAGENNLMVLVYSKDRLPALFFESNEVNSDSSWTVTCNDKIIKKANALYDISPQVFPSDYKLPTKEINYTSKFVHNGKTVYDFGKEIMAFIKIEGLKGKSGKIYYGESMEESADWDNCELLDNVKIRTDIFINNTAKAFRFISFSDTLNAENGSISARLEYQPPKFDSYFECSDIAINQIYKVSIDTLVLTAREFFIDGIKRDHWIWAGDAAQSYLMNYYSINNELLVKRTMLALLAKPPYNTHINQIMDYSLFWVISLYDYYFYSGDLDFVRDNFSNIKDLMEFCIGYCNENGLLQRKNEDDWVFVDWADGLDNSGEVSVIQMLYFKALQSMNLFCEKLELSSDATRYADLSKKVKLALQNFWNTEKQCYNYSDNDLTIKKHPNIFAILFGLLIEQQNDSIKQNVFFNNKVDKITTPYMRFYELAALCEMGEQNYVLGEIKSYWGKMLELGATSFWESFDPNQRGVEHYQMYGRTYGKSLCHSWGATPIYLISKYIVGLKPLTAGYEKFELMPNLCELDFFRTKLPIANGQIEIIYDKNSIKIVSDKDGIVKLPLNIIPDAQYFVDGRFNCIEIIKNQTYKVMLNYLN